MRAKCTATDDDRKELVRSLIEDCARGEPGAFWAAAAPRMRSKWAAAAVAKASASGKSPAGAGGTRAGKGMPEEEVEAHCAAKYNWLHRGAYQGQKLMAWSEASYLFHIEIPTAAVS